MSFSLSRAPTIGGQRICEQDIGLRCTIDSDQMEKYEVLTKEQLWIDMENYIENEMDETLHEVRRRNVVTATWNYQARVQTLMQTIIRVPSKMSWA